MFKLIHIIGSCWFWTASVLAQTAAGSKIEPALLSPAVLSGARTDFFVVLHTQADVSMAQALPSKEAKGAFVFQTLQRFAENAQKGVLKYLRSEGLDYQSFWIINAVYTKGNFEQMKTIAALPEVARLVHNPHTRIDIPALQYVEPFAKQLNLSWGVAQIRADSVWRLGYEGAGAVIAGADTGYDWLHPAVKSAYRGWNGQTAEHDYNWHDAIHADSTRGNPCGYDLTQPCDDWGHGTHTIGTMSGYGNDSLRIGVAPAARWIGARNMNRGDGSLRSYIECFEWFIAPTNLRNQSPDPRKAPHVVNNSWYCSVSEGCNASNWAMMDTVIQRCRAAGIVPVVAMGNSGGNCSSFLGPPAFFKSSFSVGATQANDSIAGFSSRGADTFTIHRSVKPDVSAPGVNILSCTLNNQYGFSSGTSMAAPHVAGVIALMISANPRLAGQVDTLEQILRETARPLQSAQNCGGTLGTQIPNNTYGFGRIDALRAVQRALNYRVGYETPLSETYNITVFPNPASERLQLGWKTDLSSDALVWIWDINGRLLQKQSIILTTGQATLLLQDLHAGMYFFKIAAGQQMGFGRFLKY